MKKLAVVCLTILAILLCWTVFVPFMCIAGIMDLAEED